MHAFSTVLALCDRTGGLVTLYPTF